MPVFFTWLKPDNITGADFLDRPALTLDEAKACRDDKRLSKRMRVPGGPRAGLESHCACFRPPCLIGHE